jgi:hypothetical protein
LSVRVCVRMVESESFDADEESVPLYIYMWHVVTPMWHEYASALLSLGLR